MTKVFMPDPERLRELGFGAVSLVPTLFDSHERYLRVHNWYLRDRGLGLWSPRDMYDNTSRSNGGLPSKKTMLGVARMLSIFVNWCDDSGLDWRKLSYVDGVIAFQNQMIKGDWSKRKRPLEAATANGRATESSSFLAWAASRKLREPFHVPHTSSKRRVTSGTSSITSLVPVNSRMGQAPVSQTQEIAKVTALPEPHEVARWLDNVIRARGYAKYLASRFILETGTRLEETVALKESQIPKQDAITDLRSRGRHAGPIHLTETKGGRPRDIQVPLDFLQDLRTWMDGPRLTLQFRFHNREKRKPSDRLFVSDARDYEGIPISGQTLYRVFKQVQPAPSKWHPHFGRHTYACHWLLTALNTEAALKQRTLSELGVDWIHARGDVYIRILSKQMGHLDQSTTDIYLRWLATAIGIEKIYTSWHQQLSNFADDSL